MRLLTGAIAYLCVVGALAAVIWASVFSLGRNPSSDAPVLAMETDGRAVMRDRAIEEAAVDPNRVPVWIAPTPKYDYAPMEAVARPKIVPVIGKDARDAMAKTPPRTRPRHEPHEAANVASTPRLTNSRRDNDPFYRD